MTHGSLFSGIGGFDLAAQWMGWENIFHCEKNEFGKQILKYYWPAALSYDDIKKTDFTIHRGRIDILSGGFPCQPYSQAGKRKGTEDDRHLWPEMLRAIREIQPCYVVGENVRGLTNWNGGMVFDQVQADLETEGYEVLPFLLPACAVNAPHRRDRIWFIAYRNSECRRTERNSANGAAGKFKGEETRDKPKGLSTTYGNSNGQQRLNGKYEINTGKGRFDALNDIKQIDVENTDKDGLAGNERKEQTKIGGQRNIGTGNNERICTDNEEVINAANTERKRGLQIHKGENRQRTEQQFANAFNDRSNWNKFPAQPPICSGDDGISRELDGITFSKWRAESVMAYGNAIVPQLAFELFKIIGTMNQNHLKI